MTVKLSNKQKEIKSEGYNRKIYTECKRCGILSKVTTHKMSYWVTHCFNCGEIMR